MAQLTIGQTVVHPNHGIGTITDVTKLDLLEEFKRYYVIDFITNNLTSRIPVKKIDDLGLRKTMSPEKVAQVVNILSDTPQELPDHFKKRRSHLEGLVHSGNPLEIAEAVRELTWRKRSDRLNTSENQLLTKARGMLVEEIALVTESKEAEARRRVNRALNEAVKTRRERES